jgi:ubiquinone/menaquinone biosynthesis C-methylase UbiE
MHDAFKIWDLAAEPLEVTERRIHDGVSGADALLERGRRYVGHLADFFPWAVPPPGAVAMEIGSGVGWVMQAALERFVPRYLIGLDVAASMAAKARARLTRDGVADPRLSFLLYDGMSVPLRDGSVDYVYSVASLQHVPRVHVYNLLLEIARVLSPSGFCALHLLSAAFIKRSHVPFAEEIGNQLRGSATHWHHFYTFDELFYVLVDGVQARQIEIVDGEASIWVSFGKSGPAFRRAELPGELHLQRTRNDPGRTTLSPDLPPEPIAGNRSALGRAVRAVMAVARRHSGGR